MKKLFHSARPTKWLKWSFGVLALLAILVLIGKGISARKAEKQALEAASATKKASASVELLAWDTTLAKVLTLASGLPISGSLKATQSALVKAKVAGELQDLKVREGDTVLPGQWLATIDPTEYTARLSQAQKSAEAAKAQVDIAQRNFDNNQSLVDKGFISKTALDTSASTLAGAKASYAAAIAAVDVAKKSLDDTKVLAPIGGQIASRNAQPGERVGIDGRIVEIVDLSRLELEAALAPSDSLAVRVGQTAQLRLEGSDARVSARVVRINPAALAGSRSVLVYLALDRTAHLRQGLFAQGLLATQNITALAIPADAVRTDKPSPYVQVIENNRVVHKPVQPGARGNFEGTDYVAVQALSDGALVLRGNVGAVREGAPITIIKTK